MKIRLQKLEESKSPKRLEKKSFVEKSRVPWALLSGASLLFISQFALQLIYTLRRTEGQPRLMAMRTLEGAVPGKDRKEREATMTKLFLMMWNNEDKSGLSQAEQPLAQNCLKIIRVQTLDAPREPITRDEILILEAPDTLWPDSANPPKDLMKRIDQFLTARTVDRPEIVFFFPTPGNTQKLM